MYLNDIMSMGVVLYTPVVWVVQCLLSVSLLLALARLIKGPDVTDRVVALDLIAGIILAFTLFYSVLRGDINFMNVGLAIAVVAFLGTVAIARYLEKRFTERETEEKGSDEEDPQQKEDALPV